MRITIKSSRRIRGFALVVTLSLMILLTVVAVGMLSLSTIALRGGTNVEARARADANARLAVMLAIGELQKQAGDDRRITADASILGGQIPQPNLVGVWKSWSPDAISNPTNSLDANAYDEPKEDGFLGWLVSSPEPESVRAREWAMSDPPTSDKKWTPLFTERSDGFAVGASSVEVPGGAYAWAVTQENTRAKVNVGGPDVIQRPNDVLHVQPRPSLALSSVLKQPEKGWNLRASRVVSRSQISLDKDLMDAGSRQPIGRSYTTVAQGLLTDAVRGGLKTDLNLGFEMSDQDFDKSSWGDTPNPFRTQPAGVNFGPPDSYASQQPLFSPLTDNPIVASATNYGVASLSFRFYGGSVPTFDHLRSFYRIPHHLYGGSDAVVASRGADHVAAVTAPPMNKTYLAPSDAPLGKKSTLSIRPVLNRVIYLLSARLDEENLVQLVITPVISLWNPFNTELEIDGAVVYPWMDLPFQLIWERESPGEPVVTEPIGMADAMGKQFESRGQSRQVDPYFFCELTSKGDGDTSPPIRFDPGEVRVFYPVSSVPQPFNRLGSNAERTIRMRPAVDISEVNKRGGFKVSMQQADGLAGHGMARYPVKEEDRIRVSVKDISASSSGGAGKYHYFVTLEDSARILNPSDSTRGQAITDVQVLNIVSAVGSIISPWHSYNELKTGAPTPFGVIETFHRTAKSNVGGQPVADLIYTTNPRQQSINHQLANGEFTVAPHFQSTLRSTPSFDTAIQTTFDGRGSYWGPSHSSSGKSRLPFFDIPRQPMLSLAGFQHADLSSSTFAPAHQFGNSWASAYLSRDTTGYVKPGGSQTPTVPIYDICYLTNEALWDSFFFSGAAPGLQPATSGQPSSAWDGPIASQEKTLNEFITNFVTDPVGNPLANTRMRLHRGGMTDDQLVQQLLDPAGCTKIAAHLMVDGAFNVNSTDVDAWTALLTGLRGQPFEVEGGNAPPSGGTALPRSRNPTGRVDDHWNGFRMLSDGQIGTLAENLVEQIRQRGPFLSLGEFINRRLERSDLGMHGALQAAIEGSGLNENARQAEFSTDKYPTEARENIISDTGVGIPGYLTQSDVLQSLAPVITCRSDTFTIRGYGEARDAAGNVIARSRYEVVVQRVPEFVDHTDKADVSIDLLTPSNQLFGRRFEIISFRRLNDSEVQNAS